MEPTLIFLKMLITSSGVRIVEIEGGKHLENTTESECRLLMFSFFRMFCISRSSVIVLVTQLLFSSLLLTVRDKSRDWVLLGLLS